jgi:diguanylate cyclase (GGDEF)-like protein
MLVGPDHNPKRSLARWISKWELWTRPRSAVILVFSVVTLGIGTAALAAALVPVSRLDLIRFGVLLACGLVHLEATRGIERMRRTAGRDGATPHLDMNTVWNFAALLLLPPALATGMVLFTQTHMWLRIRLSGQRRAPHRVLYTASAVLIANQVATAVLVLGPGPFPGIPPGWLGLGLIMAAALIRWLINYGLVVGVIMLANPQHNAHAALGPLGVQALEAGASSVGVTAAVFAVNEPQLLPILVIGLIVFHRCVLIDELQHAARTDDKTGLLTSVAWTQLAGQELARAERSNSTLGILMLDLDHFKEVNDIHGHVAGDEVLCAVAKAIRAEVREYDHVGRFGGDEFVVAMPDISGADLFLSAERLRHRIGQLASTLPSGQARVSAVGLTTSIGGALFPATAATLDDLLLAADTASYKAKDKGRDRVVLTPATIQQYLHAVDDQTG